MATNFYAGADATRNVHATADLGDDFFNVAYMENARVKLENFSKAYSVGSQLTVFYPFRLVPSREDPDKLVWVPCMSAVWGHKVNNGKLLHRTFLRSRCELSPTGEVIGNGDLAYQFSRINGLLVKARKEKELANCANKDWSILGQGAYQTARQEIEDRYDPKRMSGEGKPLLGRLTLQCTTCVYTVAMDPDKATPILTTPREATSRTGAFAQVLSQDRKDKLYNLANSPMYGVQAQHPDKVYSVGDVEPLEVLYNFTSARMDKGEAGRADPQGISKQVSILERFPEIAPKLRKAIDDLPSTSADIRAKLYAMDPMKDEDLLKALQQYTMNTVECWGALASEDLERLMDAAEVIDYLRIVPADANIRDGLQARLGHPVGRSTAGAPTIDGLVGSDENFDTSKQTESVENVLKEAEQGQIPVEDEANEFAEDMEV